MIAVDDRLDFAPPAPPGLWRGLGLAVFAHALLLVALTWGLNWKTDPLTLAAEAELWSSVPQEAAPRAAGEALEPAPTPAKAVDTPPPPPTPVPVPPAPPPEPPAVSQADIALEKEKLLQEKQRQQQLAREKQRVEKLKLDKVKQEQLVRLEKLKQEKLDKLKEDKLTQEKAVQEKQRQEEQRAREKKTIEAKKLKALEQERQAAQQAKEEASRMEAQRQANLKRMAGLAGASGGEKSNGAALRSSGPSAGYAGRIRSRIKPNIVFTEDLSGNPLAEVEVRTSPDGTILQSKLTKSSGVPAWDEAVLKAIVKTVTLPRDTDGQVPPVLVISFRPKD